MSLTFKLLSLAIRTAAKPIGNYIKRQAKEHEGFRRFAVAQAQIVHRIDMRMRLGILHDAEAQERMHERERKKEEEKKRKAETPTVRSEEEQKKFDAEAARDKAIPEKKSEKSKPNIRPLSDAKAIELGANFFSEAFIFGVAAGLLIWDAWRSRKKESARRDDVKERIDTLESELDRLRLKYEPNLAPLVDKEPKVETTSWYDPRSWWTRTNPVEVVMIAEPEPTPSTTTSDVSKTTTSSQNVSETPAPQNTPEQPSKPSKAIDQTSNTSKDA